MIFDIFVTESNKIGIAMPEENYAGNTKPTLGFKVFKWYVRFFHNKIYYRKVYSIQTENIPEDCPLVIVSNHQNSLCDPLGLLLANNARKNRKYRIITRADVFRNPIANRALRWMGLLPAYRFDVDGEDSLVNNNDTFQEVEEELLHDGTVIIFPESKHQDKRWLGEFSFGYLRILFEAAEKSNFKQEMFVLPACNHYSDYFDIQEEMVIKYGTPISLAPFYELYKTKPRTAQRQVNALVRQQVEELMLNITDLDNYEAIDYLRNTYGIKYAKEHGFHPNKLSEKLLSDKQFAACLESLVKTNADAVQAIYNDARILEQQTKQLNINDWNFEKKYNLIVIFFKGIISGMFFPLFIFALIPNGLIIYAPKLVTAKVKDPMLHSAIRLILSLVLTIPSLYLLIFALTWIFTKSFLIAIIYLVCLPFLGVFAWYYNKAWQYWKSRIRFNHLLKKGKLNELIMLRKRVYESLDSLLK